MASVATAGACEDFLGNDPAICADTRRAWENVLRAIRWIDSLKD